MRLIIAGLAGALGVAAPSGAQAPRIVSLDYCADQYVIALADRAQIAAVSRDADDDYAYLRDAAAGLRQTRASAEEVIALHPDIVVRNWGGGPRLSGALQRLGVSTHQIGYPLTFENVRAEIRAAAEAFGQAARGEALIAEMDARLDRLAAQAPAEADRPSALYVTPGGATAGEATFIHAVITASGARNAAAEDGASGWPALPLERLAIEPPELAVAAFFDVFSQRAGRWSGARHPVMRRVLASTRTVQVPGAVLSCPAWFALDAAEAIAEAAREPQP